MLTCSSYRPSIFFHGSDGDSAPSVTIRNDTPELSREYKQSRTSDCAPARKSCCAVVLSRSDVVRVRIPEVT